MQIETLKMDPEVARVHFNRYRKAVRNHREERRRALEEQGSRAGKELGRVRLAKSQLEKEDEAILEVYRHLCKGEQLINLPKVLGGAGLTEDTKLPRLAVVPADAKWCTFTIDPFNSGRSKYFCFSGEEADLWSTRGTKHKCYFHRDVFSAELWDTGWRKSHGYAKRAKALVPAIPPHLRPDRPEKYHILWEAEWEPMAPVDPILLKQVTQDHYVVVAQWDLTPVEQSVLEGRYR